MPSTFTLDSGIRDACTRAARERGPAIAVYVGDGVIYVRDAKAAAPVDARLHCIAQYESDTPAGPACVQLRYSGAHSEYRYVEADA